MPKVTFDIVFRQLIFTAEAPVKANAEYEVRWRVDEVPQAAGSLPVKRLSNSQSIHYYTEHFQFAHSVTPWTKEFVIEFTVVEVLPSLPAATFDVVLFNLMSCPQSQPPVKARVAGAFCSVVFFVSARKLSEPPVDIQHYLSGKADHDPCKILLSTPYQRLDPSVLTEEGFRLHHERRSLSDASDHKGSRRGSQTDSPAARSPAARLKRRGSLNPDSPSTGSRLVRFTTAPPAIPTDPLRNDSSPSLKRVPASISSPPQHPSRSRSQSPASPADSAGVAGYISPGRHRTVDTSAPISLTASTHAATPPPSSPTTPLVEGLPKISFKTVSHRSAEAATGSPRLPISPALLPQPPRRSSRDLPSRAASHPVHDPLRLSREPPSRSSSQPVQVQNSVPVDSQAEGSRGFCSDCTLQ
eukprot:TRINITY_DN12925_c0_g1_i1.p1 TRINITY_DN12925_c0_g1~~TRINITY_DN12925_c0_g1_i1.p1  ORF type:complete len:413 (-),score=32.75 TRINITY_DN12925_c0_g1_i1:178-1416(-)